MQNCTTQKTDAAQGKGNTDVPNGTTIKSDANGVKYGKSSIASNDAIEKSAAELRYPPHSVTVFAFWAATNPVILGEPSRFSLLLHSGPHSRRVSAATGERIPYL